MPFAYWCVLAAAILPILTLYPGKISKSYDNATPRDPDYWKDPFRARVWAASQNGVEAFPVFAASVIIATTLGAPQGWIDFLAGIFVLARLGYIAAYFGDRATLRSAIWSIGFFATIAIFMLPVIF